jgi:hypothetical protein
MHYTPIPESWLPEIFNFISIHKPPASIRFAPIKHAHAVKVGPLNFSSRFSGVAYELSHYQNTLEPANILDIF